MRIISESEKASLIATGMSEPAAAKKAAEVAQRSLLRSGLDPQK